MYAIKFLLMLFVCFVIGWLLVGSVFTAFSWGVTNYPVATVSGIFVAYLFIKEALR